MFKAVTNFLKPQILFFVIALIFGSSFIIINPILNSPDESAHFCKIWGFTQGTYNWQIKDGRPVCKFPQCFRPIFIYNTNKFNLMMLNYLKMRTIGKVDKIGTTSFSEINKLSKISYDESEFYLQPISTTSYNILAYLPSVIILLILKLLKVSPFLMLFILRYVNLATYIFLCFFAIENIPIKKLLMTTIALLPMSLYICSSINTDSLLIGLSFIFISLIFKYSYEEKVEKVTLKHFLILTFLFTYIAMIKFPYILLGFLFLLIPKEKLQFSRCYFLIVVIVNILICALAILYFYNLQKIILKVPGVESDNILLNRILDDPIWYMCLVKNTISSHIIKYLQMLIGIFGNFYAVDIVLPIQISIAYFVLMIALSIINFRKEAAVKISFINKIFLVLILIIFYLIVITIHYFIFYVNGNPYIAGFQGRYLLPILPVILLVFQNNKFNSSDKYYNILKVIMIIISIIGLVLSVLCLLYNFYSF